MHGPFLLLTGLVVKVADNGKSVLLRHSACRVWVHFHGRGQLPDGVRYGRRVAVIGRLRSYNVGTEYALTSAHCLGVSPQAMIAAALEKHPDAVLRHWNPEGVKLE